MSRPSHIKWPVSQAAVLPPPMPRKIHPNPQLQQRDMAPRQLPKQLTTQQLHLDTANKGSPQKTLISLANAESCKQGREHFNFKSGVLPVLCPEKCPVNAKLQLNFATTNMKDRLEMAKQDCACWKIRDCKTPEKCPDKCEPGKNCWEISFLHNSWEKVFEKCRHCKVFQSAMDSPGKIPHFSSEEWLRQKK